MMSKHVRWSIIKQFSSRNHFGFTFQDVVKGFPEMNRIYLAKILGDMVDNGLLCKISRNHYHVIPINADPESYEPDRLQMAKYLMQNKEYYIGYASAIKVHGIKIQSEVMEYVVTRTQVKPSMKNIRGTTYQFVQHSATRFFGFDSMWINRFEEALVSDLEKTIVDIFSKPQLCGGIIEVGNCINQVQARLDDDKLFNYFSRNGNKSAKKRFLFLTELLNLKWTDKHSRLMEELGSGISILDPSKSEQGRRWHKFGLRLNVDPIRIKEEILHP